MSKTKKIAVFFPGIGYTCDKPLLYYSAKLAQEMGYEIVRVPYGHFPPNVKGNAVKMYECFLSAREQSEDLLRDIDWSQYSDIVFFGKSVGTVVAMSYASEHRIAARQVLYTPLPETFCFPSGETTDGESGKAKGVIAFHGTSDQWAQTEEIVRICGEEKIPLYLTEKANHSLECGKVKKDLKTIREVIKTIEEFL